MTSPFISAAKNHAFGCLFAGVRFEAQLEQVFNEGGAFCHSAFPFDFVEELAVYGYAEVDLRHAHPCIIYIQLALFRIYYTFYTISTEKLSYNKYKIPLPEGKA
jgi:hypothetical protein